MYGVVVLCVAMVVAGFLIGWYSSLHHHAPPRYMQYKLYTRASALLPSGWYSSLHHHVPSRYSTYSTNYTLGMAPNWLVLSSAPPCSSQVHSLQAVHWAWLPIGWYLSLHHHVPPRYITNCSTVLCTIYFTDTWYYSHSLVLNRARVRQSPLVLAHYFLVHIWVQQGFSVTPRYTRDHVAWFSFLTPLHHHHLPLWHIPKVS